MAPPKIDRTGDEILSVSTDDTDYADFLREMEFETFIQICVICDEMFLSTYSARNAVIGSTEAPRRPGRKLANNADAPNTAATQTRVPISLGVRPRGSLRIGEAAMIS